MGALKNLNVLGNVGLSQLITVQSHNRDLIISKGLNISEVMVNDVELSYHYCFLFKRTTLGNFTKNKAEVNKKLYK